MQERADDVESRLRDMESRFASHEAVCSERYKQIFHQLKNTDTLIRAVGLLLLAGMASVILSLVAFK